MMPGTSSPKPHLSLRTAPPRTEIGFHSIAHELTPVRRAETFDMIVEH
jgi:hypothetical protein